MQAILQVMNYRLKNRVIELIYRNPKVIGEIADILDVHFTSMQRILSRNDAKLTQKDVLLVISKGLGIPENDLTEKIKQTNI